MICFLLYDMCVVKSREVQVGDYGGVINGNLMAVLMAVVKRNEERERGARALPR